MGLQTSGPISLNDIHQEAGGTSGTTATINDSDIRGLINKGSGATMSFNEWYGASASLTNAVGGNRATYVYNGAHNFNPTATATSYSANYTTSQNDGIIYQYWFDDGTNTLPNSSTPYRINYSITVNSLSLGPLDQFLLYFGNVDSNVPNPTTFSVYRTSNDYLDNQVLLITATKSPGSSYYANSSGGWTYSDSINSGSYTLSGYRDMSGLGDSPTPNGRLGFRIQLTTNSMNNQPTSPSIQASNWSFEVT